MPIAWVGLAFFGACAVFAWLAGQPGPAVVFAGFVALSVGLMTRHLVIELDADGVTRRGRVFTHRMAWDEVERVETDGVTLVLRGGNKQLPIAPRFWTRATRAPAEAFVEAQLGARGIARVFAPRASRAVTRNTRV